jgi:predicted dehydrogenase
VNHPPSAVCVAVVGAGYWGPNLLRNFSSLPGCRLAAICDLDPAHLAAAAASYPDARATTRLDDLLSDPGIDAAVVATPAESHRPVAEAALRAGKHVYVEKPLAASSADASAIVRAATETGRILMVGHLFLYSPAVLRMISLVRQGALGEVRYVRGVRTSMSGTARLDTNVVWDAFVHDAYILPALLGRAPRRVLATGQGYLAPGLEDVAFVTADFGDGVLAHVYVSWYALGRARRMEVIGSDAILAYDDLADPRLTLYARHYKRSEERDPRGRPRWRWCDDGSRVIPTGEAEPLRAECAHFLDCVRTGQQPRTDGWAGLEAVRLLEACQRSLEEGGTWVEVAA